MKSTIMIVILFVFGFVLIVGGVMLLNGYNPVGFKDTHPSCNQLPSAAEATEALDLNPGLAEKIESQGDGITVEVGKPCSDYQDLGLVMVNYDSRSERDAIRNLLNRNEGFGVPVHLVKR